MVAAFVAGILAGLATGWTTAVWIQQRLPRTGRPAYVGSLAALFAVLATITVLPTLLISGASLADDTVQMPAVQIPVFVLSLVPALTVATATSGLLALTLALLPGGRREGARTPRSDQRQQLRPRVTGTLGVREGFRDPSRG